MSLHNFDNNIYDFASGKDKHLVPEARFISALIDSGSYQPETYGVLEHQIWTNKQVHAYCTRHQQITGKAPDIGLVRRKYPTFAYMDNIDPKMAAVELKEAWQIRKMLRGLPEGIQALNGEDADPEEARRIIKALYDDTAITTGNLGSITDYEVLEESNLYTRVPVDLGGDGKLTRLTGGIAPGNLWFVSARLGIGKSWKLLQIAVAAAEAGWNVKFYSLEMSIREVVDRLHMIALRDSYKGVWADLDKRTRAELVDEWASRSGRIDIADPANGPIDASVIAGNHEDNSVAIVDYIGLMRSATGQRAIEDWRAAAMISNQLKEIALTHQIPLVSAAQINREGARARNASAEHLAQSDALGQDADVLVNIQCKEDVRRVHEYSLVKNRHGSAGARWYARFEPGLRRFEDISPETANNLMDEDIEAAAAH